MSAVVSEAEILEQFDTAADDFLFPDVGHGYNYAIDVRLHAFSDRQRWALVVELVGYTPRAGNVTDILHVFGNCLTTGIPGYDNGDFLDRIENMDEIEVEEGERFHVGDLAVRGVTLPVPGFEGEELPDVFRRLVPEHRSLLLATEAELRRRIPTDLPEILTLEQWHQPRLHEQKPSESEVYQQLAAVLARADPASYRPTLPPNTHWSNWPESGAL